MLEFCGGNEPARMIDARDGRTLPRLEPFVAVEAVRTDCTSSLSSDTDAVELASRFRLAPSSDFNSLFEMEPRDGFPSPSKLSFASLV